MSDGARRTPRRPPRIGLTLRARAGDPGGRGADRADGWWLQDALLRCCAGLGALAWPLAAPRGLDAVGCEALAQAQVAELDALILAGGGDLLVAPGMHVPAGADPLALTRDLYEYALLAAARGRALPVLGICRGAQLLHRAAGGELLPADAASTPLHLDTGRYLAHHHAVELAPGTWLAAGHAGAIAEVNSAHRWRIAQPSADARVLARCSLDGSVEAFDFPDERCTIGVMWHPECALEHPQALAATPVFGRLCASWRELSPTIAD